MLALFLTLALASPSSLQEAAAPSRLFDSTLACYDAARSREDESLAVDGVFLLSKSTDAEIARESVDVLARLGTPPARVALAVVLCSAADPGLRARAADRLGDAADRDAAWLLALDADLETNPEVLDVVLANLERAVAAIPDLAPSEARAVARQLSQRLQSRRALRRST